MSIVTQHHPRPLLGYHTVSVSTLVLDQLLSNRFKRIAPSHHIRCEKSRCLDDRLRGDGQPALAYPTAGCNYKESGWNSNNCSRPWVAGWCTITGASSSAMRFIYIPIRMLPTCTCPGRGDRAGGSGARADPSRASVALSRTNYSSLSGAGGRSVAIPVGASAV